MSGILYVVATPLGNLQDMPPRVAATFASVDFIAAEDTRVTLKLLNYLELKKPMVSYHAHNYKEMDGRLIARLLAGESCAVCTDAGMPCVSDPGEALVMSAHENGIRVVPVPAASAAVTALAVSGQETGRWCFEGFLPVNRNQRAERLAELAHEQRTMIFYEAPHKLRTTLDDLASAFGDERSVTLCRELTKLHEEIVKTTLGAARARYAQDAPKGEFCLVLAGAQPEAKTEEPMTLAEAAALARTKAQEGLAPSAACREAARQSGLAKGEIYGAYLRLVREETE